MFKGFKEFILRGNVIDLAVAVVIGAAFTAVVNSIVANIFNPVISALFQADSLDNAGIVGIGDAQIKFGAVLGAIIQFLIVAVVVYFVFVVPINHLKKAAFAIKGTPSSRARSKASKRTSAMPALPWAERNSPASRPSSVIGVPAGGAVLNPAPSPMITGSRRFFTRPRYLVRAVSSWPM